MWSLNRRDPARSLLESIDLNLLHSLGDLALIALMVYICKNRRCGSHEVEDFLLNAKPVGAHFGAVIVNDSETSTEVAPLGHHGEQKNGRNPARLLSQPTFCRF
jgi:hypothetical protein